MLRGRLCADRAAHRGARLGGHADQASALSAQLNQQALQASAGLSDWSAWVEVLKDGEAQAYRTWVLLPTRPDGW